MAQEYCLTAIRGGWVNVNFGGYEIYFFTSIEKLNVFVDEVIKVLSSEMTYERNEDSVVFTSIAQDEYNKGSLKLFWQPIKWNPPLEDLRKYKPRM